MADETKKTLIDLTALKYFYKALHTAAVMITPTVVEAASADNAGWVYFVNHDGVYAGVSANKGDYLVSDGTAWSVIKKGSEGGATYEEGTGIDISTDAEGKYVISNIGVVNVEEADEEHPGTIKVTIGDNEPTYIDVYGLDTAAFMPYEVELTEDSDDAIPTSKAVADYVADEIADLSVADSEVEGQYVASVAQEDGKVTIIRQDLPTPKDTYDATSSEAISGKGVADAIKAKQDSLSADQMSAVNSGITADLKANYDTAYAYSQETHARVDATKVEASETNGKIKINDVETTVYTHPGTGTNPHGTTKADVGLSNVGNFKAVSTVASQGLTETEKANAKANLGISDASSMGVDTSITASASNNKVPTSKAIKDYVDTEIENLPEPMIFKGSVGTGGTITSLPTAAKANMGFTYKVITAGTYASQSAKVGDTFISTGTAWELIPSGDEPSGTVTSVGVSVPTGLSVSGTPVTTSGTIAISMASGYSIPTTAKQEAWDGKSVVAKSDTNGSIKINGTDTVVYTHPTGTNPHGTTKSDVGLGNVGNFKAVSTVASQGLTNTEKSNARANIGAGTGNGTYSKPSGGIPATDLASAVQTSLGKADTALQSHQSLEDYVKTTDSRLTDARASNDVQAYAKTGSGITVAKSVPSDAKFTDTTYSAATTSANGLMSSSDKTKLNGIATGATAVSESTVSGWGFTKNAGTVTSVKVGTTSYSPSSGVVSLPAYPTSLPASNTTNSYSATGTVPVSGTAVAAAIGGLDVTGTTAFGAGKTISAWSETDGKISITSQNISITKSQISDFPSSMTPTAHNQASSTITAMTGYSKASAASAIAATDSLNTAIGKLEKALDGKAASSHNQASNTITAMTGYSKASSASAITTSDSLNTAVGKLEKKVDDKVQKTSVSSANKTTSTIAITDNSQMVMVAKISGKTVKDGTTLKSAAVESVVSQGENICNVESPTVSLNTVLTAVNDNTFTLTSTGAWTTWVIECDVIPNKQYRINYNLIASTGSAGKLYVRRKDGSTNLLDIDFNTVGASTKTFTPTENKIQVRIYPNNSATSANYSKTFKLAVVPSTESGTVYPPYNKTTVLVPSAVKNLPDYGVENNIVDFENGTYTHNNTISNGAVTAYTGTDKVIPISDYLRPLPVENGGTLTLVNEHNLDVNSTIKYKKEV